jgi:pimeloyl-ACP methyl ester carboxylesterase
MNENNPWSMGIKRRHFLTGLAASGVGLLGAIDSSPGEAQQPATAEKIAWTWGPFGPSNTLGHYYEIIYPASDIPGEMPLEVTYNYWLPDGVERVRGVIVHQHGASILAAQGGATAVYDLHWQALAKKWDCALLGPSYRVLNDAIDRKPGAAGLWMDPRLGSDKTFLRSLKDVAKRSCHPELTQVPWLLWGHSAGGIWANTMATLHPERVVALYLRSGTATFFREQPEIFKEPPVPEAVYAIPAMTNAGVQEKASHAWDASVTVFEEYRAHGAPIGFAPDPRTGHWPGDSRYVAMPFFDACMEMRLPRKESSSQSLRPVDHSQVWFAESMSTTVLPAARFRGDVKKAVWLPNERVARAWMEYVQLGTVASTEKPPAPFGVAVRTSPDGNEITWNAEAGFDSGLGGFVVMRNGRGIARLPERPPDRLFGRPLFQGLSYHDTPEEPYPRMHYRDTTAPTGRVNQYSVIALSSAGIPSDPSTSVSPQ